MTYFFEYFCTLEILVEIYYLSTSGTNCSQFSAFLGNLDKKTFLKILREVSLTNYSLLHSKVNRIIY